MSYLALYRKYRPATFEEVQGQRNVIKILKNSIINGKVSHAYLFSGPRGTGKTTTAKLIAKLINCTNRVGDVPCEHCASCLAVNEKNDPDIIEMDAASNNGVDEIRDIRDKVSLMPTISNYKIYIIDEVHMLSTGAFNALLKTLEEPPKHVIFILATTEFYKVPETIVSRCQCFNFERISCEDIINELRYIVSKENIKVDDEVLKLIAKYSDGGMRDAVNMLDKLYCCSNDITLDDFYSLRGLVTKDEFDNVVTNIFSGNVKNVIDKIDEFSNNGKNILLFANELLEYVKNLLVEESIKESGTYNLNDLYAFIEILDSTIEKMKNSSDSRVMLDVGLLKIISLFNNQNSILKDNHVDLEKLNVVPSNTLNNVEDNKKEDVIVNEKEESNSNVTDKINEIFEKNRKIRINNALATANKNILEDLKVRWINFSDYLHNKEFASVVSYLIDGNLRVAGDNYVIISVKYDSILENAIKNMEKIEFLFNLVSGKMYKIAFVLDSEWNNIKQTYVNDRKNGVTYQLQDELEQINDIIKEDPDDISEVAEDAISLFGNDLVEIK